MSSQLFFALIDAFAIFLGISIMESVFGDGYGEFRRSTSSTYASHDLFDLLSEGRLVCYYVVFLLG